MTRRLSAEMSALNYVLTAVGLFSVFCYMLELQRLGDALIGTPTEPGARSRPGPG